MLESRLRRAAPLANSQETTPASALTIASRERRSVTMTYARGQAAPMNSTQLLPENGLAACLRECQVWNRRAPDEILVQPRAGAECLGEALESPVNRQFRGLVKRLAGLDLHNTLHRNTRSHVRLKIKCPQP